MQTPVGCDAHIAPFFLRQRGVFVIFLVFRAPGEENKKNHSVFHAAAGKSI
jgi:hypothetical protein